MWAGIGLDALTIHAMEPRIRLEKFFTMPEYAARTIWQASQWSGIQLRLWADGEEVEGQFILAVATNIRHYLGGLSKLSPDAYIDDGLLDMWLFSGSNLGDALRHAYDMWRGNHITSDMARSITFKTLRIEAELALLDSNRWRAARFHTKDGDQSSIAHVAHVDAAAWDEFIEARFAKGYR